MIPAAFDYERPTSLDSAIELLARHGEDAKLLAGGHSLLPLMKLRLATPGVVVDIGRLGDLAGISAGADDVVRIGALTCHADVAASPVLREAAPLLSFVAGQVGDPQVRHRGTLGGSVAHGDPASDLPAALLALGASFVAVGPSGERALPADGFFTGFLETALAPDEVLTEIRVPAAPGAGWAFEKFNRRAQDWAIVGVAVQQGGGIGLVNMATTPVRARGVEAALAGGASLADAAARADEGIDPPADLNASTDFRRHLARVLTRRALEGASAGME